MWTSMPEFGDYYCACTAVGFVLSVIVKHLCIYLLGLYEGGEESRKWGLKF